MNDNQNQNTNPMTNGMPPMPEQPGKKTGLTLAVLVVVLLVIIGAIYMLGSNRNADVNIENLNTEESPIIRNESALPAGDEDTQIEADLDAQLQDVEYSF